GVIPALVFPRRLARSGGKLPASAKRKAERTKPRDHQHPDRWLRNRTGEPAVDRHFEAARVVRPLESISRAQIEARCTGWHQEGLDIARACPGKSVADPEDLREARR